MTARNTGELCKGIAFKHLPTGYGLTIKGKEVSTEWHTSGVGNETNITNTQIK